MVLLAAGYRDPDGNPDWLNALMIAAFVVLVVGCLGGYIWFRARSRD
jgi:hypothetical protein